MAKSSSKSSSKSESKSETKSSSKSSSKSSQTTTDLEVIKKWSEERGGKPSRVKSTADDEGGGLLRIDFPGYRGKDTLEEIPWEDWYQTFQDRNLEFLYQDKTAGGKESRFFKLINKKE